ncbi:MAG: radical SAM protein [Oscillospiraceae bacterium]|nr:radical SAM protein [Oscillospiraceae bacterium]
MLCELCNRRCSKDRAVERGFCGLGERVTVARYLLHRWEEPPISGTNGSGAVFFSGCNLRCVYCQNHKISRGAGDEIFTERLPQIFIELQERGAHNINLVTPTAFIPPIASAIRAAKKSGRYIPVVYNTNAFETVEALRELEGLVDVYLPDLKYFSDGLALKYSGVRGYFEGATKAILEMRRQTGELELDDNGLARKGLIIRHLALPGLEEDSKQILDWISNNLPKAYVSLMAQYIPAYRAREYEEINRRITRREYDRLVDYFFGVGLKNGFMQELGSASDAYVPDF